jgi:hypothetical protein
MKKTRMATGNGDMKSDSKKTKTQRRQQVDNKTLGTCEIVKE